jgi:hypothetical protein
MSRDLDEILKAAVELVQKLAPDILKAAGVTVRPGEELIDPPAESVKAFRAQLSTCIDIMRRCHQETANMPPPGKMRERAEAYLKALLVAKKRARAFHGPPAHSTSRIYPWDNFLAELDREIMWVEPTATYLVVPHGSQQRDTVADLAAGLVRNIIGHQRATLTDGGLWPELAALTYEGATGDRNPPDMMKYCREVDDEHVPRYVVRGLTFKAPS